MRLFRAFQAFFRTLFSKPTLKEIPQKPKTSKDLSHLRLLALLQEEGRLIDFLQEDISSFSDADVGRAVRHLHDRCQERLAELVSIRPVLDAKEGDEITIPENFNLSEVKLLGRPKGSPPYTGVLKHKGWKAHKHSLPPAAGALNEEILHPAEVEV